MRPSSQRQHEAASDGRTPAVELVRPGVWSVPFAMPHGNIPYSLGYLVDDFSGALHLVDTGWPTEENWATLESVTRSLGKSVDDIATVTATHLHPDHIGMAARIRERSGAPLLLHHAEDDAAAKMHSASTFARAADQLTEWGVPAERGPEFKVGLERSLPPSHPGADLRLTDGMELPIPGRHITVLLTPGHTSGHICLHEAETELILTADLIMPSLEGGLGLGGASPANPLADYLHSLRRVSELDNCEAAPGHQYRFFGLADRCAASAEHHLRRTRLVAAAIEADDGATVWQVASGLRWSAGWENLRDGYLVSALAQTQMHMNFIRSGAATPFL